MESGLEDRNNGRITPGRWRGSLVSMESGLEDRNNRVRPGGLHEMAHSVSMESGLEDRNNPDSGSKTRTFGAVVSMESGLEDRNNSSMPSTSFEALSRLNGVRPRRPEQ